jgi:hypothetical protein
MRPIEGDDMPMFISLLSLGCFGGAAASYTRYDGRYFELLVLCGVILFATSEITSAIGYAAANIANRSKD